MAATIRIQPLGGGWETLGVDRLRGLSAQGISASSNDWGPDDFSFQLAAERGARRPDLLPYTPIDLEVDGTLCWSGYAWQRPSDANSYTVGCRGWQYQLDDGLYDRVYVHTRLSDYRDQRSFLGASLNSFHVAGVVSNDNGIILLGWPNGAVVAAGHASGVTLDLGPDSTAKRVVMTWESSNNDVNLTCYCRGTPSESANDATFDDAFSFAMNTGASGTSSGTLATARRYLHVFLYKTVGGTYGADTNLRIKTLQVFGATAYESGNASILKADTVVRDALTFAPLLNQSAAYITAGTFSLPSYQTGGYITPRAVMQAANTLESYRLKIGGGDLRSLVYGPKPDTPIVEVGDWSGAEFSDATISGEQIYSAAIVDAQGPAGDRIVSKRSQTGTLADRSGRVRSFNLGVSSAVTQAVADRIADLWLTEHATAPFAGTLRIHGNGARRISTGTAIPPHSFLLYAGEKIRLANRVDPDTGDWGRDGRIAGVRYDHDNQSVEIAIDDQRQKFETVLSRYASLVGG